VIYLDGFGWIGCGGRSGCIGGRQSEGYMVWFVVIYCGRSVRGGWCVRHGWRQCGVHPGWHISCSNFESVVLMSLVGVV
jgi:hypothetical protein